MPLKGQDYIQRKTKVISKKVLAFKSAAGIIIVGYRETEGLI